MLFLCVFKHLFVGVRAEKIMQMSLVSILYTAQRTWLSLVWIFFLIWEWSTPCYSNKQEGLCGQKRKELQQVPHVEGQGEGTVKGACINRETPLCLRRTWPLGCQKINRSSLFIWSPILVRKVFFVISSRIPPVFQDLCLEALTVIQLWLFRLMGLVLLACLGS